MISDRLEIKSKHGQKITLSWTDHGHLYISVDYENGGFGFPIDRYDHQNLLEFLGVEQVDFW